MVINSPVISNYYSYHVSSGMYDGIVVGLDRYILSSFSMSFSVYFRTAISLAISDQNYEKPAIRDPYHKGLINLWLKPCKNCHCCNQILMIPSGHKFAHATTAQLSWDAQNCGLNLLWFFFMLNRLDFLQDSNYELINLLWNGSLVPP